MSNFSETNTNPVCNWELIRYRGGGGGGSAVPPPGGYFLIMGLWGCAAK